MKIVIKIEPNDDIAAIRATRIKLINSGFDVEVITSVDLGLSQSEKDVIELAASGLPYKQIGFKLGLTEQTVKNKCSHMIRKLDCGSFVEVVVKYQRSKAIPTNI